MRRLTLAELLTVTALEKNNFKTMRRRNLIALAFGRQHAYDSLSYLELDAAAMMLAETLAKSYGRETATRLIRIDSDKWAEAIAMFEIDHGPAYYVVGDFEHNESRKLTHLTGAGKSIDKVQVELIKAAGSKYTPLRINAVNVAPLILLVQKTATAHGIDLPGQWLPKWGSPEFKELFAPYVKARDAAILKASRRTEEQEVARAGRTVRAMIEDKLDAIAA
jgi:hypothetical protein